MIQMKKRYLIPTIFMGIAVGFCLTVPKQTATAAIYVEDIKNNKQIYELIENREIQKIIFL